MSNPVVLITGALTGIGRAAAVAFAKKGAKVVVAGRRDEAGKALVKELRSFGSEAEFINADVRKEDDVRALVDKTVARFGRLDVAVNNAGTEGQVGPITDQTAESYAATFDTNVLGVILSMKHEVRVMQGQGSGSIINISSTYGHEGAAGASVYVGSKHAVEGITKSVALEIAKSGIRVNAVAPGPTDTGMLTRFTGTPENKAALVTSVPMGRLGLSEELANAIVFIASDEASFITGHVLNVDGGHDRQLIPSGRGGLLRARPRGGLPAAREATTRTMIMPALTGKTALITGASRGMGRASALALAAAGAQVLVHYGRGANEADGVVAEIRKAGGRADAIAMDLAAADGASKLARQARSIVGDRLDILVANAGVSKAATIEETTVEDFDKLFAVNVRAPFFLVQQLLPDPRRGQQRHSRLFPRRRTPPSAPCRPMRPRRARSTRW